MIFRLHRGLIAASIIVPAGLFALGAMHNRAEVLREGEDAVIRTTEVLHEHARKVFETEELALERVDDRIGDLTWDQIAAPETSQFLAKLKARMEQAVSIWIADSQGTIRAGSQPWDLGGSIVERDFFRVQRQRNAGTYVSKAFEGQATRVTSFAVSRRRSTPDGHFDGTIHVALRPDYFARVFAQAALPELAHSAMLIRADGEILARDPPAAANAPFPPSSPFMRNIAAHPESGFCVVVSALDGQERVFAYRKVGAYPVYVVFGVESASLLRRWHNNLVLYGAAAGAASLLLLAMSWLALRGVSAERAALTRLSSALEDLERETTQREAAEAKAREAQKMEAIGKLTGGIAHDFNNLLMAVLGNLELLRKRISKGDPHNLRLLENATRGAQRGAALTQRLLAFGRRQTLNPAPVDIPSLVRGMSDLLRSSLGTRVEIEVQFPPALSPAYVDANQLELALLNLTNNAHDAMAGAGRLVLAAREEPSTGERPEAPGGYIVLSVTDTGSGMDEAVLARATEPFFTTKGIGKGTGLGLSMVHGLAAQSGGRLVLYSQVREGTTAELWLPLAKTVTTAELQPKAEPMEQDTSPGRRQTILVVDDDPLVLTIAAEMLEDLGHTALEATSGRQALEILRAGAQADMVITDYSMPGMTGVQLAAELQRLRPRLPVVLATGYAERAEVMDSGLPVMAKPFDQAALAKAIAQWLTASAYHAQVIPFRPQHSGSGR